MPADRATADTAIDTPIDLSSHDLQACVAMMRGGSRTFFAASRLLPPRVRAGAIALYAFCRVADDLVDMPGGGEGSVAVLRDRLDRIYAGTPLDVVEDHALSLLVQETGLPRHLLDALIEGFAWDAQARLYETIEDVHAYGARVAGSVGAMMSWVMGARQPQTLARACELGVAMQLTNIARDVGEDARNARLYLPRQWLRETGVDVEAWLQDPVFTPGISRVVERLLAEADRLYKRSASGIGELPADCRAAILAASLIYGEIGHQLRREGGDSIHHRTVVSTPRKLVLLASAWTQAGWLRAQAVPLEPLAAIAYLVDGCAPCDGAGASRAGAGFPNRGIPQRVEWVFDLLERREHARLKRGSSQVEVTPLH